MVMIKSGITIKYGKGNSLNCIVQSFIYQICWFIIGMICHLFFSILSVKKHSLLYKMLQTYSIIDINNINCITCNTRLLDV